MLRMIATLREILCFLMSGWGGKHLVTTGVAWRPVSNIGDGELKNWMPRHSKN